MFPAAEYRQLARRLQRDARAGERVRLRAELAQARAAQRRQRRLERARRRLPVQGVVAAGTGVAALAVDGSLLLGSVSIGAALLAVRSLAVMFSREPAPLPALPAAPPLPMPPPPGSVAFPYVRRLEAVRDEMRRLLPLVGPAGREAGEEAWQAAAEADAALRWQAARLAAVEPHRPAEPDLLRTLENGVACQERLVTAVADLVAASADPLASTRLQDATDRLHGLAAGLREVR